MIEYRDFVPRMIDEPEYLGEPEFETLRDAIDGLNAWREKNADVRIVSIETVVLPNLHHPFEEGAEDVNIRQDHDFTTAWNQFLRVWYERD